MRLMWLVARFKSVGGSRESDKVTCRSAALHGFKERVRVSADVYAESRLLLTT